MQLNTIGPAAGEKKTKTRVGRGIGCGKGKTCGRGHKGQRSRTGGYHKTGFEGGQMPLQRRVPKFGFNSRLAKITAEIRLGDIAKLEVDTINLETLRAHNLINSSIERAKVFLSGEINRAVTLVGIRATKGVKSAIEAAGGKVED